MHFVIIGNGVAGVTAALKIRERERKARITIISGESAYFFSRTALMYAYMDRLTLRDLEPYERKMYDKQQIERITDWVVDLDATARQLRLKSGRALAYDRLLLATGSCARKPTWKGLDEAREGIVHFVSLQDLQQCEQLTRSTKQAVVAGGGLIGVELVECLRFHGKRVVFLVREPWYWPVALGRVEAEMISDHIRRHDVELWSDQEVAEVSVDGNGRVSGVKTAEGREFACQLLGICIGVQPALGWLRQVATPPQMGRGIQVSASFATSLPCVWAAGDCSEFVGTGKPVVEQIWYSAKRQGELAALAILGDSIDYKPPIFFNSAKFFEIEYTTVGVVNQAPREAFHFCSRIPGREISIRIVEHQGAVIGFNLLGSRWNHNELERWVSERRSLEYVIEHLDEAQFEVEFGRIDLAGVRAEYRRSRSATAL